MFDSLYFAKKFKLKYIDNIGEIQFFPKGIAMCTVIKNAQFVCKIDVK